MEPQEHVFRKKKLFWELLNVHKDAVAVLFFWKGLLSMVSLGTHQIGFFLVWVD